MPLARCAMYAQGLDIYVAPTYDSGERSIATMQPIAREGVLGSVPRCAFQGRTSRHFSPRHSCSQGPERMDQPGRSVVVAPGGKIVGRPLREPWLSCTRRSTSSGSRWRGATSTSSATTRISPSISAPTRPHGVSTVSGRWRRRSPDHALGVGRHDLAVPIQQSAVGPDRDNGVVKRGPAETASSS